MTPVTQHIEPNVDYYEEFQRTIRDKKEYSEQRRIHKATDTSMYQVDTQFQNHMVRHAYTETKTHDRQDNNIERVPIKQEMDKQPNRYKGENDGEDDWKHAAKPKNDVPADDEDCKDDDD